MRGETSFFRSGEGNAWVRTFPGEYLFCEGVFFFWAVRRSFKLKGERRLSHCRFCSGLVLALSLRLCFAFLMRCLLVLLFLFKMCFSFLHLRKHVDQSMKQGLVQGFFFISFSFPYLCSVFVSFTLCFVFFFGTHLSQKCWIMHIFLVWSWFKHQ